MAIAPVVLVLNHEQTFMSNKPIVDLLVTEKAGNAFLFVIEHFNTRQTLHNNKVLKNYTIKY